MVCRYISGMARTLQQQLDDVDTAIARIENGLQEWSEGGHRSRAADLATLYQQRRELARQIAAASRPVFRPIITGGLG